MTPASTTPSSQLESILGNQRRAFEAELPIPAAVRRDRLRRLADLVLRGQHDFTAAVDADFGGRPPMLSRAVDVLPALNAIRSSLRRFEGWMKPERREVTFPLGLLGAKAEVRFQPKGVIGLISPWNYPLNTSLIALASMFAAGNRVMMKPSELTPTVSALIRSWALASFGEDEWAVVTGDADIGAAFSNLPFDHLYFTGSTAVGQNVMAAAARHLTPVTLELGGKSPVLIGTGADLRAAASRVVAGKLLNGGQTCVSPDYVLIEPHQAEAFTHALIAAAREMYPTLENNPDYTAIISPRRFARLTALLDEARAVGAEIDSAAEQGASRRMPLHVVRHAPDHLGLMQEELFGPILPIVEIASFGARLAYVKARPRPLALYYFGNSPAERAAVLDRTVSGGVTLGDVMYHAGEEDLPFGGIGASGVGAYHGRDGFMEFSHKKAVYTQVGFDLGALIGLKPPYGPRLETFLRLKIGPSPRG